MSHQTWVKNSKTHNHNLKMNHMPFWRAEKLTIFSKLTILSMKVLLPSCVNVISVKKWIKFNGSHFSRRVHLYVIHWAPLFFPSLSPLSSVLLLVSQKSILVRHLEGCLNAFNTFWGEMRLTEGAICDDAQVYPLQKSFQHPIRRDTWTDDSVVLHVLPQLPLSLCLFLASYTHISGGRE